MNLIILLTFGSGFLIVGQALVPFSEEVEPMKHVAPLRYGVIFKKAFGYTDQNPAIQKGFDRIEESQITPQERAKMKDEAARKETIDEKAKEIACKMLRRGRSVEEIAEDTGLTQEQVKELL